MLMNESYRSAIGRGRSKLIMNQNTRTSVEQPVSLQKGPVADIVVNLERISEEGLQQLTRDIRKEGDKHTLLDWNESINSNIPTNERVQ